MTVLHSSMETDLRLAVALDQNLLVQLTDTATIRNSGAISYLGTTNGTGSDTSRLRLAGLSGADPFVATAAENTSVAATALSDSSVDIAVVRAALRRDIGDVATATGFATDIDTAVLAADMVASYESYFNSLVCTAIASASGSVGTSGSDMQHGDFADAIYRLELASVPGPYFAILHPRQYADWQESLRGEGGALQFHAATAEQLAISGPGMAGTFLGVQIMKLSDVTTDGTDRLGAMFGAGCLGYKVAIIDQRSYLGSGAAVAVRVDEVMVEIKRSPETATTVIVGNAWCGVGLIEDDRICGIVTDA